MTDLTAATPVEIDTELARIWGEIAKYEMRLAHAKSGLAKEMARTSFSKSLRDSYTKNIAEYGAKIADLYAEARPFDAEFGRRGGWNRYFLVTNSNGHVHRERNCSTCFATTEYAWLIDLADCDEDAMIAEWGETACTVCFPSAPSNPNFSNPSRRDREAREAKAAEKAAREAAKAEKAITAPDGSPLRVPSYSGTDLISTKVAARNELSRAVQDFGWYGDVRYFERAKVLAAALDAAGISSAEIIARASKKIAKEGGEHVFPTF